MRKAPPTSSPRSPNFGKQSRSKIPAVPSPVPAKPAPPVYKKSNATQTDKLVLIKEETLVLSFARIGVNDGGMRRDYVKAINYINSVHAFINQVMDKNTADKANMFVLPYATNFTPIFTTLLAKRPPKRRTGSPLRPPSREHIAPPPKRNARIDDKRSTTAKKSPLQHSSTMSTDASFEAAVAKAKSKPEEAEHDPVALQEQELTTIEDTVRKQLDQFLVTLHDEFQLKPAPKPEHQVSCLDMKPLPAPPPHPPPFSRSASPMKPVRSVSPKPEPKYYMDDGPIVADFKTISKHDQKYLFDPPVLYSTESSEIASDSEIEINM